MAQSVPVKGSIRLEACAPRSVANNAFRTGYLGVYSFALNPSLHIASNFFIGPVATYRRFRVSPKKVGGINSILDELGYGGRAGYVHFFSDYVSGGLSIQGTQDHGHFFRLPCADKINLKYTTTSISPELFVNFLADENFMMGASMSFVFQGRTFNPNEVCLDFVKTYSPEDLQGKSVIFSIGLSMAYMFTKDGKKLVPRVDQMITE